MAQDRPTASELLAAIADFLREEATPALDKAEPRLGFQMRVAVNLLSILEREARLGPPPMPPSRSGWPNYWAETARSTSSTASSPASSAPGSATNATLP